ncbi:MAG: ComEC/Rec2 family competence protein [Pseudomonadota bacterium]
MVEIDADQRLSQRRGAVDYAATGGRLRVRRPGLSSLLSTASSWAAAEADRAFLWAPAAIGVGALFYFSLRTEPPAAVFLYPMLLCASLWLAARARGVERLVSMPIAGVGLILFGGLAADLREAAVSAPRIFREAPITTVTGRLARLEESPERRRLTIDVHSIDGLDTADLPARVRVTWRGRAFDASPGDVIAVRSKLSEPPPPAAPGAFDFSRHLYFQRIGGVGFAVAAPEVMAHAEDLNRPLDRARAAVESARVGLARRIRTAAPGAGGGVVAALVTGKRGGVDEASETALRDAGLAHLLAISGLHMGLAAGIVFFGVRLALAAIPALALRFPIKKWAAAAALASSICYLILSGSGWSARRAFIMTGVLLVAVLFDRRAISLRNVALAATLILPTSPEAVLHPGFQMSFAAATALIAAFDASRNWWERPRDLSLLGRLRRYAIGVAATDVIAATATAPFGLYHFHRAAVYSLAANLVATPIMAFWIMPAAIIGLLTVPIGIDAAFWRIAAGGVEVVLAVAAQVSSLDGAVALSPQWPAAALGAVTFGGLWICLSCRPWRAAGLAGFFAGAVLIAAAPRPQVYIAPDGDNAALWVEADNGEAARFAAVNPRRDRFLMGVWMELSGLDPLSERPAPLDQVGECDEAGCVARVAGRMVAFSHAVEGLPDDCARADLVVALYPAPRGIHEACQARLIDRRDAWRHGAHTARLDHDVIEIRSVRDVAGVRPWSAE